ncbi:MAG: asparagine synthase-related protein, partial [Rhodothermales bacterium]|nr:asparagine synthase-related protein [Rhodothermales bacterium]
RAVHALDVVGYSPWSDEKVEAELLAGTPPSAFPGDFVVAGEGQTAAGEPCTFFLTSVLAVRPYFYAVAGGAVHHGPTVFGVAERAGLAWTWNARAVNCLAVLDHVLDEDTLHAGVHRLRPCSLYVFVGERHQRWSDLAPYWNAGLRERSGFDATLGVTKALTEELLAEHPPALSLSAGYDSRLLFGLGVGLGHTPVAASTMGTDDATDVRIARQISERFGVPHHRIDLDPTEYLTDAATVIRLTGGAKTVQHWHTYLFAKHAAFPPDSVHLAGSNGEFVRTYYIDKGAVARAADTQPAERVLREFFALKGSVRRRLPEVELSRFYVPDDAFTAADVPDLCVRLCAPVPGFLQKLDWFYAVERVRHFIGYGLALYTAHHATASPFIDTRFIRAALGMPRRYKMNDRFHRAAIAAVAPDLLDFPVDDSAVPMREKERPLYWLRKGAATSYNPTSDLLRRDDVQTALAEDPELDRFVPREQRLRILETHNVSFLSFLLTMHYLVRTLRDDGLYGGDGA